MSEVVITNVSEYRADGSYWFEATVDGKPFPFRWTKPLNENPGGQYMAQTISDQYNRVAVPIEAAIVGQTVIVPGAAESYEVVFGASPEEVYEVADPKTIRFTANVNALSADQAGYRRMKARQEEYGETVAVEEPQPAAGEVKEPTPVTASFSTEEFINLAASGRPAAPVVAEALAKAYADSQTWGAVYLGTFTT